MNEIVMLWYYRVFQFKLYLWQVNVKFITEVLKLQETNRNTAGASQVVHLSRFSTLGSKARIWHSWHRTLLRLPGSVCIHEFHNSICIHKIQQILFPIFSDWKKTLKTSKYVWFCWLARNCLLDYLKAFEYCNLFNRSNICNFSTKSISTNSLNRKFYKQWTLGFCIYMLVVSFQPCIIYQISETTCISIIEVLHGSLFKGRAINYKGNRSEDTPIYQWWFCKMLTKSN